jgi:hypothetical protein
MEVIGQICAPNRFNPGKKKTITGRRMKLAQYRSGCCEKEKYFLPCFL